MMQQFVHSLCLCYQMFVKNTYVLPLSFASATLLCKSDVDGVFGEDTWIIYINHHARYVRVCFLAWWCRASLTGTWGVWPSKLWYPTPFNLKLLLRQASWMPWLHLANGQGVGSEPQDLPVSSGLVTSLHWQQPTVTFPMGQALQVELEDAESRMRTPSPFDRDPEILHSFPGAGFPWKNPTCLGWIETPGSWMIMARVRLVFFPRQSNEWWQLQYVCARDQPT